MGTAYNSAPKIETEPSTTVTEHGEMGGMEEALLWAYTVLLVWIY